MVDMGQVGGDKGVKEGLAGGLHCCLGCLDVWQHHDPGGVAGEEWFEGFETQDDPGDGAWSLEVERDTEEGLDSDSRRGRALGTGAHSPHPQTAHAATSPGISVSPHTPRNS